MRIFRVFSVCCVAGDFILLFVYAQAMFADGQYLPAVDVVRGALVNLPADQPTVFYPRGLYADEAILKSQIERLRHALSQRPYDYDLSLLVRLSPVGRRPTGGGSNVSCQGRIRPAQ